MARSRQMKGVGAIHAAFHPLQRQCQLGRFLHGHARQAGQPTERAGNLGGLDIITRAFATRNCPA